MPEGDGEEAEEGAVSGGDDTLFGAVCPFPVPPVQAVIIDAAARTNPSLFGFVKGAMMSESTRAVGVEGRARRIPVDPNHLSAGVNNRRRQPIQQIRTASSTRPPVFGYGPDPFS
jgi:hypothetical protein